MSIDRQVSISIISRRLLLCLLVMASFCIQGCGAGKTEKRARVIEEPAEPTQLPSYEPRDMAETSALLQIASLVGSRGPNATLQEISDAWSGAGMRAVEQLERNAINEPNSPIEKRVSDLVQKASILNYEGDPNKACIALEQARGLLKTDPLLNRKLLYQVMYLQGVTGLRRGENDNCIMCRGESSCILPVSPSAVHANPSGSRHAIKHFSEYLEKFPDDLAVRWLLNLAHMTLGEYPDKVDQKFLITLDHYMNDEFDIGRFRDVGHLVGVNQFSMGGGGIMEDFDNDGLLDIAITSYDPTCPMNLLRNTGDGRFEDRTSDAGLSGQLGGLYCSQTDYNNDGWMDIFIVRGAWLKTPVRPTLLRNEQNGKFTDVTEEAGLLDPVNSISASWADYDNDGWLDLFICCEQQPSRLYHNLGNGTFEEVAAKAGLYSARIQCKGSAWFDYDNDDYPDLFQNFHSEETPRLYHNERDGTFKEVSNSLGIESPSRGFSCWAFDYDNDGWEDLFTTHYLRSLPDVVKGLMGRPHRRPDYNRLYRNMQGQGFEDVTKEAGLDYVCEVMGSNFGDFDNDGFLDMYLGTGDPDLSTLVPNRMFKNVGGKRFAEVSASSGTGHLQKGHGTACGDWDRDGNTDIFIEMGGAVNGDKYHNILFQNPGHDNNWLTVKLVGKQSNRPAIGARIKVVTSGETPQTFYRHVCSGSSFGANPLQQTMGLGRTDHLDVLEIHWPTSGTTQVFRDVAVNQAISITEFADDYQKLNWTPVPVPKSDTKPDMNVVEKSGAAADVR